LQNEIDRLREDRASAQRDLAIYDRHHPGEQFTYEEAANGTRKRVPVRDEHREGLVARVHGGTAELVRLQEEQRSVAWPNLAVIEDWLARLDPAVKFTPVLVALPKLGKNERLAAALERNADDQRRIGDELATVQNAPRTVVEAKAAMRAEIARLPEDHVSSLHEALARIGADAFARMRHTGPK